MRFSLVVCAIVSLAVFGCGEDPPNPSADCPETGGTGALSIAVEGLPSGVAGKILIASSGEPRDVGSGGVIDGLSSGEWSVMPQVVAKSGGLVRAAYDGGTGQIVCVRDGETTNVTVGYGLIPSSQKLWLSTSNGAAEVQAFAESLLGSSANVSASVLLQSKPAIPRASGVTFDRHGNLWVALGSGELRRYPAHQLGESGEKSPDVILKGEKLSKGVPGPVSLTFDRNGNLWVSDHTSGKTRIHKVPASSLRTGTVTPSISLDGMTKPPAVGSLGGAAGLAFDSAGNLWAAFGASGLLVKFPRADLSGSGEVTLTPEVQIAAGGPKELAFDEEGNLWMANNAGKIARLNTRRLESHDEQTPDVVIESSDLGASHGVAVYPAPANLPLFHSLP